MARNWGWEFRWKRPRELSSLQKVWEGHSGGFKSKSLVDRLPCYLTNGPVFAALPPSVPVWSIPWKTWGWISKYCTWMHRQLHDHAACAVIQSPALGRHLLLFKGCGFVSKCLIIFSLNLCFVRDNGSQTLKEETQAKNMSAILCYLIHV